MVWWLVLQHFHEQAVQSNKLAATAGVHFSAVIQEWKNVLLRGKDPKKLEKYWASHLKNIEALQATLKTQANDLVQVVSRFKTDNGE